MVKPLACLFVAVMLLTSSLAMLGSVTVGASDVTAQAPSAAPTAPLNLVADSGDMLVWLWWDHPSSQGSELIKVYNVYRGDTAGTIGPTPIANVEVGDHFFEDYTVINGNTYYYLLKAESDAGLSPASNTVSASPDAGGNAPGPATSVTVINQVYSTLVSWNAPSSPGSQPLRYYHVYRGADTPDNISYFWPIETFDWKAVRGFEDTNVLPGRNYYYAVAAENIIGEGAPSAAVGVLVAGTGSVPSAPSMLLTMPGDGDVILMWNLPDNPSATGIQKFQIFRGTTSGGESPTPIGEVYPIVEMDYLFTIYSDETVTNDIMYYYFVKAVAIGGSSPAGEEGFAQPSNVGVRPGVPYTHGSYGVFAGDGQVLVYWGANYYNPGYVVNITGYEVYRSQVSGTAGSLIATVDMYTFHIWDNTSANGVTYYYTIKAKWQLGLGDATTEMAITPSATGSAPSISTLYATPERNGVRLYSAAPEAGSLPVVIGYQIFRGTTPGGEGASPIKTLTIESLYYPNTDLDWIDTTATPQTTYYYKVKAIGFYGSSVLSNEAHSFASVHGEVPDAPSNLQGSSVGDVVHLTWTFPSYLGTANYVEFDIYVNLGTSEWFYTGHAEGFPSSIPEFYDEVPSSGTYHYKILATSYYGDSQYSNEITVVVTTSSPPSAPLGLTAHSSLGIVNLNWNEPTSQGSSPIIRYDIYRSTVIGEEGTLIGNAIGVDNTYYGDSAGIPETEYYYVVKAVNSDGSSPASNVAAGRIIAPSAPTAPRNLQVASHIGSVSLSWEEPSSAGSSTITRYYIYRGTTPGGEASDPIVDLYELARTYTDTTGTPGQSYYYVVKAENSVGMSPASNEVIGTFIPPQAPTAPRNLVATSGVGYVVLNWQEPSSSGSSTVIRYDVYRGTTSGSSVLIGNTAVGVLTYNNTVVSNGTTYYYHVVAVNAEGTSPDSNMVQGTPAVPVGPSAPRNFAGISGNGYVLLNWDVPTSSGTSAITGYAVFRGTSMGSISYLVDTTGAAVLTYNDTAVSNGVTYYYQVKAMNSDAGGALSTVVTANPIGPVPPTAPRDLIAWGTPTYVILNWTAPVSQGTTAIIRYEIYRGISADIQALIGEVSAGVLTYNDTSVSSNLTYYYKVKAVNSIGPGPFSDVAVASTTVRQAPSQPRNLVTDGGNGYVKLEWELPTSPGSSPILRYAVFRGTSPVDVNSQIGLVDVPLRAYNDTSVVNGNTYYYEIKAMNEVGPSGPSNTAQATPAAPSVPSAPGNLVAAAGVAKVDLTWSAATSSTTIIRYDIFRGTSEGSIGTTPIGSVAGTVLAYNDNAVTGGVTYYYKVKATNSVGTGPASEEAHGTPTATVPSAPQNVAASPGPGKVTITWAAPSSSGGSAITGYKVYLALIGGAVNIGNVSGSTLSYVDSSGTSGTTYTYYVVAVNGVGAGANSAQASAAPQAASSTDNTMLYAGIAIAIIVVIAIVVMLMRRKK